MKQYIILGLLLVLSLFILGCSEDKYTPPASNEAVGGGCGLSAPSGPYNVNVEPVTYKGSEL